MTKKITLAVFAACLLFTSCYYPVPDNKSKDEVKEKTPQEQVEKLPISLRKVAVDGKEYIIFVGPQGMAVCPANGPDTVTKDTK
jgi:protein involved in sex pheromone biosynthesis